MARIILKSPYVKPDSKRHVENYVRYIATRDGVQLATDTSKYLDSTDIQKKVISRFEKRYPETKELFEYKDYISKPNRENADEYIIRVSEMHSELFSSREGYLSYVAERPRVEKITTHGLFSDDGIPLVLSDIAKDISESNSNIWTHIISLTREDAERLGYNTAEAWMNLIRSQRNMIAQNMKISPENFKWYAAFHNESHHPHIHLVAYSADPTEAYLTEKGISQIKKNLAHVIFRNDLISVYDKQTAYRDTLRQDSGVLVAEIVSKINEGVYDNPALEEKLSSLADILSKTSSKKVYGYLKADVKDLIDSIVDELAADSRIAELYDLWYQQREEVIRTYTDEMPKRVPLSQNKEFKSVRNAVIQEAMNISMPTAFVEDIDDKEIDTEPSADEADREYAPSAKNNSPTMWGKYHQAKELLDRESDNYDPDKAVELLIDCANMGCGVAKYRLGKMFLLGENVPKNIDYALRWLEESVSEGNQFAEYLLGKTLLKGIDVEQDLPRAEDLLRRSESQGNKYAAYTLGKALLDGKPLTKDIPEALRLLKLSVDKGFTPAEYVYGKLLYQGDLLPQNTQSALEYLEKASVKGNPFAAYLTGKIRLTEDAVKDILKAIRNFEIAAENGNDFAEYQLGKIYLYGRDIPCDYDKAMAYLNSAAEHGNQYAAQLLHSIQSNRNWGVATASIRLLHHISRMVQNHIEDERKNRAAGIDRKLRRKIDEKKQAHGLKQG